MSKYKIILNWYGTLEAVVIVADNPQDAEDIASDRFGGVVEQCQDMAYSGEGVNYVG